MITIKLDRDPARQIQEKWFPYLVKLCDLKIRDAANDDEMLFAKLARSIVRELLQMFNKKLDNQANHFDLTLQDHDAAIMYALFLQVPMDPKEIFMMNIRTQITSDLHKHLLQIK